MAGVVDWVLTGRETEVALARDAHAAGRTVVLVGELGVGKTSLAVQLHAADDDRRIVRGSTSTRLLPLGAMAPLLAQQTAGVGTNLVDAAMLARAYELLVRPSGGIVVEDAQWLDDATSGLLTEIALSTAFPITFCLRDEQAPPAPLRVLLASDRCTTIRLAPLGREAIDTLLTSVVGPMDVGSQQRVFEATGGLPLLVRLLVEQALESGDLVGSGSGTKWNGRLSLEASVARRILDHVIPDRPSGAMSLVELLATARTLPVGAARALSTDELIAGLEAARIIVERDGLLSFRRPILSEIAAAAIGTFERRRIAARLLEAVGPDSSAEVAVRRFEWMLDAMAGGLIERDAAPLLEGADRALDRGEPELASRLSEAAASIDPGVDSDLRRGMSAAVLGDRASALALLEPIIVEPTTSPDIRRLAVRSALRVADRSFIERNEPVVTEIVGQPSAEGEHPDLVAAWSAAQAFVGRWHAAKSIAEPLTRHPDIAVRLRAAAPLTGGLLAEGRCQEAADTAYDWLSTTLASDQGQGDAYRWAAVTLFSSLLAAGRIAELEGLLAAAPSDEGFWTCAMRGRVKLSRGHCRAACTEFLAALREPHHQLWRGWLVALAVEAMSLTSTDPAQFDDSVETAIAPPGVASNDFERSRSWAAVAQGDLLGARSSLAALASRNARERHVTFEATVRYDLLRLGAVGRNAERLEFLCASWDSLLGRPTADHAAGRRNRDSGRLEAAGAAFAELGMDLYAAEAWADAATQHRKDGLSDSARRCGAAAATARERCGNPMTPILNGLGPTVALTAREREVALRAAAGDSSRQIAEALGVSVRTVDNLLGRVYTKLGVGGRSGLGAVMGTDRNGS